jgi:CBS domain containing-hemolysin-like protein
MAVYDERNQFVGIITAEDLMEEIIGEIRDEDEEPDRPTVQRLASGAALIDGTALVEEVCAEIGLKCALPDGVDTFGGLLLSRLGREPQEDDVVRIKPWTLTIKECDGFSIRLVECKGPLHRKD